MTTRIDTQLTADQQQIRPVSSEVAEQPAPGEGRRILIRPPRGWQFINLRELWECRELLYFLVWRDVKVRYKQTLLGAAWAVLQPALMMIVFTVFFGRLAGVDTGNLPYQLFAYAGLLPWTFFETAIANAGNSVVGSERLITKIYFPRLAIPLASVGASVVDFVIACGLLAALMVWYHVAPGIGILLVPVLLALIVLAAAGIGAMLAALNVAYRDFRYVIPFLVRIWMFATPSVYMATKASHSGIQGFLLAANPLNGLIAAFRAACLGGPIAWGQVGICAAVCVLAFFAGCIYFRRQERNFADVI
jgi:lipopolysaccharide transport system permease protein